MITINYMEIRKAMSNKVVCLSFVFVMISLIYMQTINGEFGQKYNQNMYSISVENGNYIVGAKAYSINREQAELYAGKVNDEWIYKINNGIQKADYVQDNNRKIYNSTFNYLNRQLGLDELDINEQKKLLNYNEIDIRYGFVGDWEALYILLDHTFLVINILTVVLTSYVVTIDKDCHMIPIIETSKNGGRITCKNKVIAIYIVLVGFLLLCLSYLLMFHFIKYGFDNYDTSIQFCSDGNLFYSNISMNLAELTFLKVINGILGVIIGQAICMLIASYSINTYTSVVIGLLALFGVNYNIYKYVNMSQFLLYPFAILPVNASMINVIMGLLDSAFLILCFFVIKSLVAIGLYVVVVKCYIRNIRRC